ncbi:cilia- and flagella-associated protein 99-like [Lolium rigidum]|uniref:cilia- and flagella-associated protein 99-like n=1 Tax=Lolium rigidum TaxID=89674 RepID=UPI001F5CC750|nr:cilia- and flagella-associated protein 99-like [Lolium rigidum]
MSWDSSACRSGSFEAGLRAGASSASSSSFRESKPSPRFQRSRSTAGASKASPSPEKRRGATGGVTGGGVGAMPMQQRVAQLERERDEKARLAQLEEDIRREREEKARVAQLEEDLRTEREDKARAMRELDELRNGSESKDAEKVQLLEREVEKAKESERKMLESLIYQTKQLEQAKIGLEEAKLEISTLQQQQSSTRSLEPAPASASGTWRGVMEQMSVKDLVFGGGGGADDEELRALRADLRAATQGEERSRKALEDLSVALADVTAEAKQVKRWLADAQAGMEAANAEAGRLRAALADAETGLREQRRRRLEAEEAAASWADKERVLLGCVRAAEEEVCLARQENTKLVESQRVIRDENARLRDILKQAVGEANVVKESLELARVENARLNDVVDDKEGALQSLRQEYECVKVSEAAAQSSLKELNSLLAATTTACSTPVSSRTAPVAPAPEHDHYLPPSARLVSSAKGSPASRRWMAEKPRTPSSRSYSVGEPAKFKGVGYSQSARMGNLNPKDRMFASLSNIADLKSAADCAAMDDYDDEFDHIDESHYVEHSMNDKKKRPIFRKFGDLFRRKSFYKANLAPVHT